MYRRTVRQRNKKKRPLSVNSLDDRSRQSLLSQLVDMSAIGPSTSASTAGLQAWQTSTSCEEGHGSSVLRRSTSDISAVGWAGIYRSKSDGSGTAAAAVSPNPLSSASRLIGDTHAEIFFNDLGLVGPHNFRELARHRNSRAQGTSLPAIKVEMVDCQQRQRQAENSIAVSSASPPVKSPTPRDSAITNSGRRRNSPLAKSHSNGISSNKTDMTRKRSESALCSERSEHIDQRASLDAIRTKFSPLPNSGSEKSIQNGNILRYARGGASVDPVSDRFPMLSPSDIGRETRAHCRNQPVNSLGQPGSQRNSSGMSGRSSVRQDRAKHSPSHPRSSPTSWQAYSRLHRSTSSEEPPARERRNIVNDGSHRRHSMASDSLRHVYSGGISWRPEIKSGSRATLRPNIQAEKTPSEENGGGYASCIPLTRHRKNSPRHRNSLIDDRYFSNYRTQMSTSARHERYSGGKRDVEPSIKSHGGAVSLDSVKSNNVAGHRRSVKERPRSDGFWLSQDMSRTYPNGGDHHDTWLGLRRDVVSVHQDYFQHTVAATTTVTRTTARSEVLATQGPSLLQHQQQPLNNNNNNNNQHPQESTYDRLLSSSQVPEISLEGILLANAEFVRQRMAAGSHLLLSQVVQGRNSSKRGSEKRGLGVS